MEPAPCSSTCWMGGNRVRECRRRLSMPVSWASQSSSTIPRRRYNMPTRFEEGRPESLICFVGEAPSFVETRMGRPFVGPSGEVFNDCLHAAGIIRHLSYITNVFDQEVSKDRED